MKIRASILCTAIFSLALTTWPTIGFVSEALPRCDETRIIQWNFGERSDTQDYSGAGSSEINNRPRSITLDSKGDIYVGDSVNYQVVKFGNKGAHLLTVPLQKPLGKEPSLGYVISSMTVDNDDNLYVLNFYERRIEVYSPNGKFKRQFAIALSDPENMYSNKVDIGLDGNVYVYRPFFIKGKGSIYSKGGRVIKENLEESSPNYFKDEKFIRYNGYRLGIENKPVNGDIVDMITLIKNNKPVGICGPLHLVSDSSYYIDKDGNIFLFEAAKPNEMGTLSNSMDIIKIQKFSSTR